MGKKDVFCGGLVKDYEFKWVQLAGNQSEWESGESTRLQTVWGTIWNPFDFQSAATPAWSRNTETPVIFYELSIFGFFLHPGHPCKLHLQPRKSTHIQKTKIDKKNNKSPPPKNTSMFFLGGFLSLFWIFQGVHYFEATKNGANKKLLSTQVWRWWRYLWCHFQWLLR